MDLWLRRIQSPRHVKFWLSSMVYVVSGTESALRCSLLNCIQSEECICWPSFHHGLAVLGRCSCQC